MSGHNIELTITSLQNPQVKADRKLRDRRRRRETGLMSVEGHDEFFLAYANGLMVVRLYICAEYLRPGEQPELEQLLSTGLAVFFITAEVMKKLSYREHPDAWFCVARQPEDDLSALPLPIRGDELYIIAEDIEKPGNLGAILRSADASGVSAVIVSDGRTDLSNPNVVRSAKAVNFSLPCASTDNQSLYRWLQDNAISIAIADPGDHADLWSAELPGPLAVVLGAENEGVSEFWRERADVRLNIPMVGSVNSLNVAQAGTLIMYELLRRKTVDNR